MSEAAYTVIDVETTGLSPTTGHRVVEIGIVYVAPDGGIEDRWSTLINPQRDVGPTHIHGITATAVSDAPRFCDIAPYVLRALQNRVIVAHNASFDLRFLAAELIRSGINLSQLPLVGLCTMQWSSYFLDAPSRRLVDCCAASGIAMTTAHSAAGDALATASLLQNYLASGSRPPWHPMTEAAATYAWPRFRGDFTELRLTTRSQTRRVRQEEWLELIVSGMPRAADHHVDAYLDVLEMALLDGILAEHEKAALVAVAREHGLSRGQVIDIHSNYLAALAEVAWADGTVTASERAQLELVARLLNLPAHDVDAALVRAQEVAHSDGSDSAVRHFATAGLDLAIGDAVALTGEMSCPRSEWERRLTAAGLVPTNLTKKTRVLVAADPNSLSGKAEKARCFGVPIISEEAFARLLTDMTER